MSRSSERERLALLRALFGAAEAPSLGVGDDAAVLVDPRPLVATVDAAVEGVHFRRDLLTLEDASARACEAAMSDIAAMGASLDGPGCGLLLSWTLPPALSDEDFLLLARGALRAARRVGTRVVGGNLSAGVELSLSTTVLGRAAHAPLLRGGARAGDRVAISGPVGAAALGLRALLRGDPDPRWREAVDRWRHPLARVDLSAVLSGRATACIDVSDGLALDAARLAEASGARVVFDRDALRLHPYATADEALDATLHGGEDYELLATGPASAFDARWTLVGEVLEGAGVYLRDASRLTEVSPQGWDHFSAT
ncbi:MAG: thiamine-phosphate kinase [Polyangiales bacterium]